MSKSKQPASTEGPQTNQRGKLAAVFIIFLLLLVLGVALYFLIIFGVDKGIIPPSRLTGIVTRRRDEKLFKAWEEASELGPERVSVDDEQVDIVVTDYTSQIKDICQELVITAKIKNLSDKSLDYDKIVDEDSHVFLDVICEELEEKIPFFATAKDWTGVRMTDFGIISPGEEVTIELVVIDKLQITDEAGNPTYVIYENPFSMVEENGIYNLRIEIGVENNVDGGPNYFGGSQQYILGKSNTFPVEVSVLSEPGFYKACQRSEEI